MKALAGLLTSGPASVRGSQLRHRREKQPHMPEAIIEVRGLAKRFGDVQAVAGVDYPHEKAL